MSQGLLIVTALGFWAVSKRVMPTADYNNGLVLINAIMLVGSLAGLNGHISLPATIARRGSKATGIVARTLALTAVLAALGGLLYYVLAGVISQWPQIWLGWLIIPLACAGWTVFSLQDGALAGVGRSDLVPIENLLYGLARFAVLLLAIIWLDGSTAMTVAWVLPLFIAIPVVLIFVFKVLPSTVGDSNEVGDEHDKAVVRADAAGSLFSQALFRLIPLAAIVVIADEDKVAALSTAWLVFAVSDTFLSTIGTSLSIANPAEQERSTRDAARLAFLIVAGLGLGFIVFAPLIMQILIAEVGTLAVSLVRFIGVALFLRAPFHLALARARMLSRPGALFMMQLLAGLIMIVALGLALLTEELFTVGAALVFSTLAVLPVLWFYARPAPTQM